MRRGGGRGGGGGAGGGVKKRGDTTRRAPRRRVGRAGPPIFAGSAEIGLWSANSQAERVAISFGAAARLCFATRIALPSACAGRSPLMRRSNSLRLPASSAERRLPQSVWAVFERCPALRQAGSMSAGTSNGAYDQPSFSRAPLISSAPSGEPWHDALPALLGAP